MEETGNSIHLRGHVCQPLQFGHELFGEQFFVTTLRVPRLSGAEDFLPVTLSERLLIDEPIAAGSVLCLDGQLRSYNKVVEGSGRLLITAFAQRLLPEEDDENPNRVQLTGALCKAPSYRTTPFGREIADLMLAVNRSYGKSDYIPCITWGRTARYAANLKIGDKVQLVGRFQSRNYQKQLPDGTVLNKVAYEVSVSRLSAMKEDSFSEQLQSMSQRIPLQDTNMLNRAREY
ncbi:MAG: single-stranded DNA-binding protein [Candidatus Limiplasma sp.]|jgi:single-stranded DNA-binding protein|nr:single-stranded DNA-binding protein [Clostridiales bacterium]MDY3242797.1 single-stranded DNA-binding protein [Candidatus Limiplasma sp.]MDY4062369.1 single-stranded DNA-binding protein [Candidatus Limiplasma sp.]